MTVAVQPHKCLSLRATPSGSHQAQLVHHVIHAPLGFTVLLLALTAVAVIDIAVIVRRKRRGEPG